MRRRPGRDTQFPSQHCTAVNSANGGCSYTSPRSMRLRPRTRRSHKHDSLANLRLRHRSPTCRSSRAPNARCCRGHLPWPNGNDRRLFRTRPLKPSRPSPATEGSSPSRAPVHRITSKHVPMDDRNGFATKPRPPRRSRTCPSPSDSARSPREHSP
jgi:hypothetical protein